MTGSARRPLLVCGIAGALLFVAGSSLIGALTPGYDPVRSFVSELSRTASAPAMKAVFVVSGVLVLLGALGVRSAVPGRRALPATLGVLGLCLAASGIADTDRAVLFAQSSAEGRVHGLLGAVVFVAMPVAAALGGRLPALARRFRTASTACAAVLVAGDVVLKVAEAVPGPLADARGVVQRGVLVFGLGWIAAVCGVLSARGRH